MKELLEFFDPRIHPELAAFISQTLLRLLVAAFLGGMIGLERESKGKAAGLRTNMFICFGSAMYTVLSFKLGQEFGGDHTRIAAQIIPGIGFIGAGSILHSRGGVSGLTSAATIFVVASIGMAAGGGLMLPALFATLLLLVALRSLAEFEARFLSRPKLMSYEFRGPSAEAILDYVGTALEHENRTMHSVQIGRSREGARITFSVEANSQEHERLTKKLQAAPDVTFFERVTSTEGE